MTPKDQVLAAHPDADTCYEEVDDLAWTVFVSGLSYIELGLGKTEAEAWADAARNEAGDVTHD